MTIFLCVLVLVALVNSPEIKGAGWWATGFMFGWVLLVLGLGLLALWSHQGRLPW